MAHFIQPAPLAQLDRASDFGSEGYGFESYTVRFQKTREAINTDMTAFLKMENDRMHNNA